MGTGTVPARGAQIPRVPPAGDEETDKALWVAVGEGESGDGCLRQAVTLPALPSPTTTGLSPLSRRLAHRFSGALFYFIEIISRS